MADENKAAATEPAGGHALSAEGAEYSRRLRQDAEEKCRDGHKGAWHPFDLVAAVLGSGAAVAATVKHWVDLGKTALTERGKTRREQLRQDGQTERARIAAGSDSPVPAEPDDGPPEDDAATPGDAP